ncbi:hypothetical protein B4N89_37295 [Embleya scabrispora]|uniref:Uncharacterized protein n=1 Tax=Embleya scabrispora TaxID=159449 RepID=A0A1T3NLZ5_9ACTN|nr:hypothetical protein [Embleya scabrispora]OPC77909.1 hypothetical protein B4N89_37295 [Embleya scabrispora]
MSLVAQSFTVVSADEPLLSYDLTTNPDPVEASPENPETPPETCELILVAARRSGTAADVESIKVKIPAGTAAPDFALELSKAVATISLSGWTVALNTSTKEFVFTPTAAYETIGPDQGITIQISELPVSRKVGSSPVTVTERSRTGSSAFQNRQLVFSVGKFPPGFYMRNLICDPLVINNGGDVTLTWERSANAAYELLYGGTCLNVGNESTRKITNVKSDTTFYLRGTVGETPDQVVRILTCQVTVIKPDLEVGNLVVHGTTTAKGDVTVDQAKTLYARTMMGLGQYPTIDVGGHLNLSSADRTTTVKGPLVVAGPTTAKGDVSVTEDGTTVRIRDLRGPYGLSLKINSHTSVLPGNNVTIADNLTVSGTSLLNGNVTVAAGKQLSAPKIIAGADGLTVTGPFAATGSIMDIVGPAQVFQLSYGRTLTFTAPTAGLAIGEVHTTGNSRNSIVKLSGNGTNITASAMRSDGRTAANVAVLPIRKGGSCSVYFGMQGGDSGPDYRYAWLIWVPFGKGAITPSTVAGDVDLSDSEPKEAPEEPTSRI